MTDYARMMKRQQVLADFGEFALGSQDLDEVLTEACRLVGETLGTGRAKILEIQADGRCLFVRAGVGWDPGIVGRLRLPMDEHSSETFAISEGKPVITQDISKEERFDVPEFLKKAGVVALANVPIRIPGGTAFGLLQVDATEPRDFGPEDTEFLRTYTMILGPVIDRLQKVRDLGVSEARQAFLLRLSDRLQALTDPDTIMSTAAEVLAQHLNVSGAGYARVQPDGRNILGQVGYTDRARSHSGPLDMVALGPELLAQQRSGATVAIADVADIAATDPELWNTVNARAFVSVPLVRDRHFIAVLYAAHHAPRSWSRDEVGLIEQVAARTWDTVERSEAERARRESEERFRAVANLVPDLLWRSDTAGRVTWFSDRWYEYTGQSDEALGDAWQDAIHPDDRELTMVNFFTAADQGSPYSHEHRIRGRDGLYRWFLVRAEPIRDGAGASTQYYGAVTNIDELRQVQEQQKVMVAELQHRTRNLLGVVRSIAEQTMARTGPTEAFTVQFNDRLSALSRVQGLLSRSDREPITITVLVQTELDALGATALRDRIVTGGPDIALRKGHVQTFALALHELGTNARKYGALSNETGRLSVTWRTHETDAGQRRLVLDWVEEGIHGPRDGQSPAARQGYGRKLIEQALPYALDAQTRYDLGETALRCSIDIPLSKSPRSKDAP